jgi:catechol 2,3-dioxygenase-like lactoylglutathione lyase family enzyme
MCASKNQGPIDKLKAFAGAYQEPPDNWVDDGSNKSCYPFGAHNDDEIETALAVVWIDLQWQREPRTFVIARNDRTDGKNVTMSWAECRARYFARHKEIKPKDDSKAARDRAKKADAILFCGLKNDASGGTLFKPKKPNSVPKNIREENLEPKHSLWMDIDGGPLGKKSIEKVDAFGVARAALTSYNNGRPGEDGKPVDKLRIILPTLEEIPIELHKHVAELVFTAMGFNVDPKAKEIDPACLRAGQVAFLPAHDGSEQAREDAFIDFQFDRPRASVAWAIEKAKQAIEEAARQEAERKAKREEKKAKQQAARERARESANASKYETEDLASFLKYCGSFNLKRFIVYHDDSASGDPEGSTCVAVVCPFEDDHENPGPEGETSCFAFNKGDAHKDKKGEWDSPYMSCLHSNSCKPVHDTWDYIDAFFSKHALTVDSALDYVEDEHEREEFENHRGLPHGFWRENGFIWTNTGTEDNPSLLRVCGDFRLIALVRDEKSGKWGREIAFADPDGVSKRFILHDSNLQQDFSQVCAELAAQGLDIGTRRNEKEHFANLLRGLRTRKRVTSVSRPGWHDDRKRFMTPTGEMIGGDPSVEYRLDPKAAVEDKTKGGTRAEWDDMMERVATIQDHAPHLVLGPVIGCAGPLVDLLGLPSLSLYLEGDSSKGKTLTQVLQVGVWSNPFPGEGNLVRCNATTNALDAPLTKGNDTTAALDEIGSAAKDALKDLPFRIEGGRSKARKGRAGEDRETQQWRTVVTLSGEKPLTTVMGEKNGGGVAGAVVRMPTLSVSGLPTISPDKLDVKHLREVDAMRIYGHAGPAFVGRLITDGYAAKPEQLRDRFAVHLDRLSKGKPAIIRRTANLFALLLLTGDLMREFGIYPETIDTDAAVRWAWETFTSDERLDALDPAQKGVDVLVGFLLNNPLKVPRVPSRRDDVQDIGRIHSDGAWAWQDKDHFYVLKDRLGDIVGSTTTPNVVLARLDADGVLLKDGKNRYRPNIPGMRGKNPNYRLSKAALGVTDENEPGTQADPFAGIRVGG